MTSGELILAIAQHPGFLPVRDEAGLPVAGVERRTAENGEEYMVVLQTPRKATERPVEPSSYTSPFRDSPQA